jgi:Predicted transcriptional regulators
MLLIVEMKELEKEKSEKKFDSPESCPVRLVVDRIGRKWSILILLLLNENGVMRFNAIEKAIGDISQRMLSKTLRMLEEDGFVAREIFPTVPPKVEYRLTAIGSDLVPHLEGLTSWALNNLDTVLKNRAQFADE